MTGQWLLLVVFAIIGGACLAACLIAALLRWLESLPPDPDESGRY